MCIIEDLIHKIRNKRMGNVSSNDCPAVPNDNNPFKTGIMCEILFLTVIVLSISYFLHKHDAFEWLYQYTRDHEEWELDEWFCIFVSLLFGFFVLAQHRLYMIFKMHKKLKETNLKLIEKERSECQQRRMVALGSMASGLAHEISNALQPVFGLGEFVKAGLKESGNEKHLAYMNTIMNGAFHARGIIDNVLLYSRGKEFSLDEYWARPILLHTLNFCASVIPPRTQCIWEGLNDIEGPDEHLILRCNETGLSQIFFNLMKNASDAMEGGGEIKILIERCEKKNDQGDEPRTALSIKVSDVGCGMNQEVRQRIFEPFFSTKDASEGTGLGLAGVYSLMQQHNGEIEVESMPGEGTTFTLIFPVTVKQKIVVKTSDGNAVRITRKNTRNTGGSYECT